MVMLSRLLRHRVTAAGDRQASLLDLVVDLSTGDYPTVTRLIVRGPDGQERELPWSEVKAADWSDGHLQVTDLEAARPVDPEQFFSAVLLKRDVMDALVLDLERQSAVRANDLWLYAAGQALLLRGVDISPWALIRRLGHGLLGQGVDRNLVDWRHVEFLRGDPVAARGGRDYHRRVGALPPAIIARLVDALPYLHAVELLTLIPDPAAADALEAMTIERQVQVFEEFDRDQAAGLLVLMAPESVADLLRRLDPLLAEEYLNGMPNPQRRRVLELLQYPDDTVGGIMTNDVVMILGSDTVSAARTRLRDRLAAPDFVYYLYVVDDEEHCILRGLVTLRDLLTADDDSRIEDIMNSRLLTVEPSDPARTAADELADNHLLAIPVVNRDRRLLGVVTVDAALAQLAPAAWRQHGLQVFS